MDRLGLITSTGRTGTQFFSYFINNCSSNAFCQHEPHPSRRFKFYSNLYLSGKISESFIAREFAKCRCGITKGANDRYYVESNNFLFGCIQPLSQQYRILKLLHVVRDPKAYIISHLKHGFWKGIKKITAQYVPYWLEKLALAPGDRNNPVRILANRWVYVNEVIARRENDVDYLLVRFEDLFGPDQALAADTLNTVIQFFQLDIEDVDKATALLKHKKNVGRKKRIPNDLPVADDAYVVSICRRLCRKYGYATDP
jgi:hypothetical protein